MQEKIQIEKIALEIQKEGIGAEDFLNIIGEIYYTLLNLQEGENGTVRKRTRPRLSPYNN